MHLDSGTILTLIVQTIAYIVAGWKYVQSLNEKISDLRTELTTQKTTMELRLSAVERKDSEINKRLERMEAMLVEIRLELKDKADRHA